MTALTVLAYVLAAAAGTTANHIARRAARHSATWLDARMPVRAADRT